MTYSRTLPVLRFGKIPALDKFIKKNSDWSQVHNRWIVTHPVLLVDQGFANITEARRYASESILLKPFDENEYAYECEYSASKKTRTRRKKAASQKIQMSELKEGQLEIAITHGNTNAVMTTDSIDRARQLIELFSV